VNVVIKQIVQF